MLAVDGTEPQELRKMMQLEIDNQAEYEDNIPKVFESAGGFAPTIGIIGAVLGLIQVMQHLDNINEVGKGIAVAFVATVYGVGSANLFFLPSSGKLRLRIREEQIMREMTLEGVISILEGMNPRMLESKLIGFLQEAPQEARTGRGRIRDERSPPQPAAHVNHERWLVSYADFVTLLFAFFVVLYASAQIDKRKAELLSDAIEAAFQQLGVFRNGPSRAQGNSPPMWDCQAMAAPAASPHKTCRAWQVPAWAAGGGPTRRKNSMPFERSWRRRWLRRSSGMRSRCTWTPTDWW